ncbi:hypothetical protein [Magnetococcus marinus]|uniref:hypothetical protein n=1 Tax=Magnetococcus marinus TaxID=1124597 RepID=UPI00003C5704|nr:hypothetical protein [Magnetococcus marinus]
MSPIPNHAPSAEKNTATQTLIMLTKKDLHKWLVSGQVPTYQRKSHKTHFRIMDGGIA